MAYAAWVLLALNAFTFYLTWLDKRRAIRRAWRVPEAKFMTLACLGGSIGLYAGCRVFRHKVNHVKFMVGVPLILAFQAALAGVAVFLFHDSLF